MRTEIFLLGIIMVIIGPIITILAASSCLTTILSGHVFACVTDLAYFVIGGTFFVVGVSTAMIGLIVPDPAPAPAPYASTPTGYPSAPVGPEITCKKCGRTYSSGLFFCPSCGQRPG
jgi:hypothetical protein